VTTLEGFRAMEEDHQTNPDRYAQTRPAGITINVVIHGSPANFENSWFQPVIGRVVELLSLPKAWAGPGSESIAPRLAEDVVSRVLPMVMPGLDYPVPQIVPTRAGGLQLEWHRAGWDVEVDVSPLGEVVFECERSDRTEIRSGTLPDDADVLKVVLKELA
jgi:hypothetical protein